MGLPSDHPAQELLSGLLSRGESKLTELVEDRHQEGLHVEFKLKYDPTRVDLDDSDKKNLGKVLSSFSNSEGGLLIWGIGTSRVASADVASEVRPIANIRKFANILADLSVSYLSPKNSGIEVHTILTEAAPNSGIAVLVVPPGPNRPYMSNAPTHRKYFQRTSTNTLELEHFQVADLFAANRNAMLTVRFTIQTASYTKDGTLEISFHLSNTGIVGAEYPYVWFQVPEQLHIIGISPFDRANSTSSDHRKKFVSPPSFVLFPEEEIVVAKFLVHVQQHDNAEFLHLGHVPTFVERGTRPRLPDCEILIWIGANNSNQMSQTLKFSSSDLLRKLRQPAR